MLRIPPRRPKELQTQRNKKSRLKNLWMEHWNMDRMYVFKIDFSELAGYLCTYLYHNYMRTRREY